MPTTTKTKTPKAAPAKTSAHVRMLGWGKSAPKRSHLGLFEQTRSDELLKRVQAGLSGGNRKATKSRTQQALATMGKATRNTAA